MSAPLASRVVRPVIAARNFNPSSWRIRQNIAVRVGVAPVELRPCFIVDAGGGLHCRGFRRQFGAVKV